jgi:hypothetical protein
MYATNCTTKLLSLLFHEYAMPHIQFKISYPLKIQWGENENPPCNKQKKEHEVKMESLVRRQVRNK